MPYGAIGAGAAAGQGVDAAALATKLLQVQQEINLRRQRNDMERAGMLLNAGDVQGAGSILGSSNLEDPLQRQVYANILQSYLQPPRTPQEGIMREIEGSQPPSMEGVKRAFSGAPASVSEAKRTPPIGAGGPMQGPNMSKLDLYASLIQGKGLDEAEMEARRLGTILRSGGKLNTSQKLFYIQHVRGIKDPIDAVLTGVAGGDLDINEPAIREMADAGIAKLKASGQAGEQRLLAFQARLDAMEARNQYLRDRLGFEKQKFEQADKPKVEADIDTETIRKPLQNLENNLKDIQRQYTEESKVVMPTKESENQLKQKYFVRIGELFRAAIEAEKDPKRKQALQDRMLREQGAYRPALGKEPARY